VPANVRFYTGGGGSVRGYSYQSLGPLTDKEPDGGLSFTELSIESRFRWDQHWGGVIFLDGGFSYEDNIPQFGRDLRWSTGVGLRYFTSFAPIRIDIALPLNKREDIDDSYKLYISIGQAF
jgi:translocation and assembly module TamA